MMSRVCRLKHERRQHLKVITSCILSSRRSETAIRVRRVCIYYVDCSFFVTMGEINDKVHYMLSTYSLKPDRQKYRRHL